MTDSLEDESIINYFSEDREVPKIATDTSLWLEKIAASHQKEILEINYIFCSDDYLLEVNREYLDHDYYTDIITFDNSEDPKNLESDIFISLDRVEENAKDLNISFDKELLRVMAHGLLHLCGFKDKSNADAEHMREQEDSSLILWENMKL